MVERQDRPNWIDVAVVGAGPNPAEIADEVAGDACAGAREQLGAAAFAKKLGTVAKCKAKVAAQALTLARAAVASCTTAADKPSCIRKAIEAQGAKLEAELRRR